jgi:hypothetical protein
MKNARVLMLILSTFVCLNSNSQIFVGGNIRLNSSNSSTTDTKSSSHNVVISPDFGKYLSDKLAVGVSLNYYNEQHKSDGTQDDAISSIGLSPFIRYDFFTMGKFAIYGQGNIGLDFRKAKPYPATVETKSIRTYLRFNPGLSYELNDHILLQTSTNFLSFGYDYIASTHESPKLRSSSFNLNTTLDNVISLIPLNIGAIYRF